MKQVTISIELHEALEAYLKQCTAGQVFDMLAGLKFYRTTQEQEFLKLQAAQPQTPQAVPQPHGPKAVPDAS